MKRPGQMPRTTRTEPDRTGQPEMPETGQNRTTPYGVSGIVRVSECPAPTNMFLPDDHAMASMAAQAARAGFERLTILLRAARTGRIGLLVPNRDAALSKRWLRRIEEPTIAMLGDDDYQ